jgi:predicted dinucleotide-binding enzyme
LAQLTLNFIRIIILSFEYMKIGILGSGDVGRKLADGLIEIGHEVKIGTRDPTKEYLVQWVRNHVTDEKASVGTLAEAAAFGELVIIATLWNGIANAIELANPTKNIMGKIVIDVTNPLDFSEGMPPKLAIGHTDSAGETVQRLLPNAKVIKTLNIVGNPHMVHPDFPCGPPTMFIGGRLTNT